MNGGQGVEGPVARRDLVRVPFGDVEGPFLGWLSDDYGPSGVYEPPTERS